jgi:hypothetical protein
MSDQAAEEPPGERRSVLEALEARSAEDIAALSPHQLVFELDLLFDQVIDKYGKAEVVKNELRATERLHRLAMKHEDLTLAQGLADDAAYLRTVVPRYRSDWSRRVDQWYRLWRALEARIEALPERR